MTTTVAKKICVKCVRGAGIVTCDGCHQSFCHKHLSEHRKELLQEAEQMNIQCVNFSLNLNKENDPQPLLAAIDLWEQNSLDKIKGVAEKARNDVQQMNDKTINHFNQIIAKIQTKINLSKETDDVTEIDLVKWKDEIQTLQNLLKKPYPIGISVDDAPTAMIKFIKINYKSPFIQTSDQKQKAKQTPIKQETLTVTNKVIKEKFNQTAGHATLSDKDLIVTFVGYSSVQGINRYGTGIHKIKFEIIDKKNEGIFFGIINADKDITPRASELPSVYGWRDFDRLINNGNAQLKARQENNIQSGDLIILTIDCDHPKLILFHQQLNEKVTLNVDINKSPLPWKLLLSSFGLDVIAINH